MTGQGYLGPIRSLGIFLPLFLFSADRRTAVIMIMPPQLTWRQDLARKMYAHTVSIAGKAKVTKATVGSLYA